MENEKAQVDLELITSRDEVENVRTFVFERGPLKWIAGQNQAFVLPEAGETEKENQHWFTISSAPSEGTVNVSTRISGSSFKQKLNSLKPGDRISTHSLGGKFVWEDESPITMVAAGIGITPFRSILIERNATSKPLNATLLYFNRTRGIPFQKELEQLAAKHPEFSMKIVVGESVTAEKIFSLSPHAREHTVYISGPAPMVSELGIALKEKGVAIKLDRFPGYDEANF